jgi:transposase InsO family protein
LFGLSALMPKARKSFAQPNTTPPHVVEVVLAEAVARPTLGARRLLEHLTERDVTFSASGAQKILTRHNLAHRAQRVAALAQITAVTTGLVTDATKDGPFGFCHLAARPEDLVALDTFYVGKLAGVGAVHQLTAIDTTTRWAVCQLIAGDRIAAEAARFVDHVTAVHAGLGVPLRRVLSDNGPEFTGRAFTSHLTEAGIDHHRIPPQSPNHKAMCERFQGAPSKGVRPAGVPPATLRPPRRARPGPPKLARPLRHPPPQPRRLHARPHPRPRAAAIVNRVARLEPWTDEDEAIVAAFALSVALTAGHRPVALDSSLPTFAGETVHSNAPAQLQRFTGANVGYNRGAFVAFGSPLFTAATLGGSLLYNRSQRQNAQRQAAAQWRHADSGLCYLTTHRLAVQGAMGWVELPWRDLRNAEIDPSGIVIWAATGSPMRLIVPAQPWHYVLLRFLAWGQIVPVPIPDALIAKAAQHGRPLPNPPPLLPPAPGADPSRPGPTAADKGMHPDG